MSITVKGIDNAVARVGRYGSTQAMVAATHAGCEAVRHVLRSDFISGQYLNIRSSRLIGSWEIWDFDTPAPGSHLYTDVFYARILEYGPYRGRSYFHDAVAASREKIRPAALEAWRAGVGG